MISRHSDTGANPSEAWVAYNGVREKALAAASCAAFRCTVPLAHLWVMARAVEEQGQMNSLAASYRMCCGTGSLEAYAVGPSAQIRAFGQDVRIVAEDQGGALSVLDGWPVLGSDFDAWGAPREADHSLMRAMKEKFDPRPGS